MTNLENDFLAEDKNFISNNNNIFQKEKTPVSPKVITIIS